jgi:hypothetical protein
MAERDQPDKQHEVQQQQDHPFTSHRGENFKAVFREEERDGETHFIVGVYSEQEKEIVVFDFNGGVSHYTTGFLSAEQIAHTELAPLTASPQEPQPQRQPPQETEHKPVKLTGKITSVGQLHESKKKKQPMFLFTFHDETNNKERRAVAFDSIAQRLAAPETDLQPGEEITLFAWKHENTLHVNNQPTKIEDWYVQRAIYKGAVYEKPRTKQQRRDTRR